MPNRRAIVIAGAGIGGLTAALALATRGFHVIVCERAPNFSELGAGIQLSPNVGRVLASLGLDNAIAAAATEPSSIDVRFGPSGRLLTAIPLSAVRKRYGFPWRVIARSELQAVLVAAAATNPMIELRLGADVVGFGANADELLVEIETNLGRTAQSAAALIAADGVRSTLRQKLAGTHAAKPIGRTAWRATVPARVADGIVPSVRAGLWIGPDAHLVHYPIAGGATINIVAIVPEEWTGPGWSEPGDRHRLAEHFSGWCANARAIVAAPAEWRKWAILAVNPDGPWADGRVALLGDAAHALPPYLAQGAALAIEDASVLAGCLAAAPDDTPSALRAYEAARRPRAIRASDAAFRTGSHYHLGQPLAAARNAALLLAGWRLILARNDWIYGWKPGHERKSLRPRLS